MDIWTRSQDSQDHSLGLRHRFQEKRHRLDEDIGHGDKIASGQGTWVTDGMKAPPPPIAAGSGGAARTRPAGTAPGVPGGDQ